MSDTNAVGIAIALNSSRAFPLTVGSGPLNLRALRTTGLPNLAFEPTFVTTDEFRQDGQVTDIIRVGGSAGGDNNFELSYGAHDDLLQAALFNVFARPLLRSGATAIAGFGAGTIDVEAGGGSEYVAGQMLELRDLGVGDVGRGIYELDSIATDTLTVSPLAEIGSPLTNPVLGSFAAVDDDPANDVEPTELQVIGYRAGADGEIALTVTGGVATLTASGSSSFAGIKGGGVSLSPGDRIKLAGFPLATSNVYARVETADATTITFEAPSTMVDDAAASERVRLYFGDEVVNGVQPVSSHEFAVELSFADHNPVTRKLFLGMAVAGFNLQVNSQAIVTGTATFLGRRAKFSTGENAGTGQGDLYAAGLVINRREAPQFEVYNSTANVGRIGIGADPVAFDGLNAILDGTIELTRNLRENNAVGFDGAASIGRGEVGVTGTLNTYFDSGQLALDVLANEAKSFDLTFRGQDGRAVTYDVPRFKYTGGAPAIPAKNQDVTLQLPYQGLLSKFGYTVKVARYPFVE